MKEIDKAKYKARKEYEYDDDIGILFYNGEKIARCEMESYRKSWLEEDSYFDNMSEFLDDVVGDIFIELDDADNTDSWEHIWDGLDWDESSKSYKFGNWELVVLDV